MTTKRMLMVSGALLAIAAVTLAWLFVAYLPGMTPLDLFLDASVVLKLVQMAMVLAGLLALVGGATGEHLGTDDGHWVPPGWGGWDWWSGCCLRQRTPPAAGVEGLRRRSVP